MVLRGMTYEVKYRSIKYPRLEFKTGQLRLILPHGTDPHVVTKKHTRWITEKQKFIEKCFKASKCKTIADMADAEFKRLIHSCTKDSAKEINVEVNKIRFRKMRTKWASCSPNRNLIVNTLMKYLPRKLIEYIVYHELVHLVERHHNDRFWELISRKFDNFRKLEVSLFVYWFLLYKYS
jgi:predicted metal-dependent hydrolase